MSHESILSPPSQWPLSHEFPKWMNIELWVPPVNDDWAVRPPVNDYWTMSHPSQWPLRRESPSQWPLNHEFRQSMIIEPWVPSVNDRWVSTALVSRTKMTLTPKIYFIHTPYFLPQSTTWTNYCKKSTFCSAIPN